MHMYNALYYFSLKYVFKFFFLKSSFYDETINFTHFVSNFTQIEQKNDF